MKFAHFSDIHIGGWREEKLKLINLESFSRAVDICIQQNVGFVIISGDLFNTALPQIDLIKKTAEILKKLRDNDISVYIIPGSHDYSPSGKTMIDVLEKAGLVENVFKIENNRLKFTIDKTNAKLTGILGMTCGLEKSVYQSLNFSDIEKEPGFKIFLFHTLLTEFKPKDWDMVDSESIVSLPKNFSYYAGGHPHFVMQKKINDYGLVTYPGPMYPNNFKELEELKFGGFYIVDDKLNIEHIKVKVKDVISFVFNADEKIPSELQEEIVKKIKENEINDKIITIRAEGILKTGKPSDINFNKIISSLDNAYIVLKNTAKLKSKEFEEIEIKEGNVEDVEREIINEHLGQITLTMKNEAELANQLMLILNKEKHEGETNSDFESRLLNDLISALKIEDYWHEDK